MTSSDNVQIPIAQLYAIGGSLNSVKADLEGVESAVVHLLGVDDVHGFKIASAVSGFFSEWKSSRRTLLGNVGTLGDVSVQIADITQTFDSEVASALGEFAGKLSGGGSGGGAASGGAV